MSPCSPPQVLPLPHLTGGLSQFHQLPISLKETLNQLGVKSEEAGVGAVILRKILSPKPAPNPGRTFLQQCGRKAAEKAVEAAVLASPQSTTGCWDHIASRNNQEEQVPVCDTLTFP